MRDKRKKVYLYGIVRHDCYAGFVPVYTAKNKVGAVIGFHEKEAKRLPKECLFLCETETTQSAFALRNRRFFINEMRKV